ncbi:uncharacterized protein LOC133542464 isoform X3 [Nerophis ophidion]|uniref:uncharacterized protein LOC133542464 isoform X3 n=1 Tax=Nerophis ophidion TaxID=159077 RepID=UPI002ADF182A|nr:uncharacterized protein LOC133542464 isoform X3 [Nerophis ophidion]
MKTNHLSPHSFITVQILSSSVRLDGERWWSAILRSLQGCSIGFKSGLRLGHSRTVTELFRSHSFVIVLLEGEPSAQSEVHSTLEKVFVQDISVLGHIHRSFNCKQSSCPCSCKTPPQHDAATTTLDSRYGVGQVMSGAWFSPHIPLRIKDKKFYLCLIRPENFIYHSLGVLHVFFGKFYVGFYVSYSEESLPSGHSAIKP